MNDEQLIWVDEHDNILGSRRKSEMPFLHRVSLIIPRAYKNKFFISKRSEKKEPFPGVWVCLAGEKSRPHEEYLDTALRGMDEEAGVTLNNNDLVYLTKFLYNKADYQAWFGMFTTRRNFSPSEFKLDKSEIQYAKDFYLDEIRGMVEKTPKQFAPTFIEAIKHFRNFI